MCLCPLNQVEVHQDKCKLLFTKIVYKHDILFHSFIERCVFGVVRLLTTFHCFVVVIILHMSRKMTRTIKRLIRITNVKISEMNQQ